MIHQTVKELAQECDEAIAKFKSFNIDITDTENEHSLMVFLLVRHGYTLRAVSSGRAIKSCTIKLDDCFHLDELLQDLHTLCENSINNSKRYTVAYTD